MPANSAKVAIILFVFLGAWFASAGFLASDDWSYSDAARSWLTDFPFVGNSHWSLRQTLVLPLAALYGLFGVSEPVLILPAFLYYLGLLFLVWCWLARRTGQASAWVFVGVAAATPGFVANAGVSNVDVIELFFITASLMAFYKATEWEGPRATGLIALAGALAGLAFLSRATAVALLFSYALFFLVGAYHVRIRYLALAIGGGTVYALDTLYYWAMTGDLFYRAKVLLGKGEATGAIMFDLPSTGNLMEGTLAEPVLSLLINNEFGLTFLVAAVLYWLAYRRAGAQEKLPEWLKLFLVVALIQFLVVGYAMGLRPLPRYFSFSFIPALVIIALSLPMLWIQGQRRASIVVAATLVVSGLVLTDLTNRQPRFASSTLVTVMKDNRGLAVHAPREVCDRAKGFATLDPSAGEIRCSSAADADLLLLQGAEHALVDGDFTQVGTFRARGTVTGWMIRLVGLDRLIPFPARLFDANEPVRLYRRVTAGVDPEKKTE